MATEPPIAIAGQGPGRNLFRAGAAQYVTGGLALALLVALVTLAELEIVSAAKSLATAAAAGTAVDIGWGAPAKANVAADFLAALGVPDDGAAGWRSIALTLNMDFLSQVFVSVISAVPSAVIVVFFSFFIVCVTHSLEVSNFRQSARVIVMVFDLVPYVIWPLFFIVVAQTIFEWRPPAALDWPLMHDAMNTSASRELRNLAANLVLHIGYAAFLTIYFYRESRQWVVTIDRRGVFDDLRVRGLANREIYFRIFRNGYLQTLFSRQVLFAIFFAILLDFSFVSIHSFHQPYVTNTSFREGAYHRTTADLAEKEIGLAMPVSAFNILDAVRTQRTAQLSDADRAALEPSIALLTAPAIDAINDRFRRLCDDGAGRSTGVVACRVDVTDPVSGRNHPVALSDALALSAVEEKYLLHRHLNDIYTKLNLSIIFLIFIYIFFRFDLRELTNDL